MINSSDNLLRTNDLLARLSTVDTLDGLAEVERYYLGKQGVITLEGKTLKDLSSEERITKGADIQAWRQEVMSALEDAKARVEVALWEKIISEQKIDVTANIPGRMLGTFHPLTLITKELVSVCEGLGFTALDGYEAELDAYNFEALNIPANHPARDSQDTFYLTDPHTGEQSERLLLRTHTSAGQVRSLKKFGAPLRAIIPGRVFRNEATDETHDYCFNQLEGLCVDKNISVANMFAVLEAIIKGVFGKDTVYRIRPNYFPFVEPGYEIDMLRTTADGEEKWLEILGCGMIHPHVLSVAGLDPEEYSGFAFGMGVTRLAMLKFGITDIRLLMQSDKSFLSTFTERQI